VETHRHTFGVAPLLATIGEPVSTFYDRANRGRSMRAVQDTALAERIEAIWERSLKRRLARIVYQALKALQPPQVPTATAACHRRNPCRLRR
jgi:hypothetical protein